MMLFHVTSCGRFLLGTHYCNGGFGFLITVSYVDSGVVLDITHACMGNVHYPMRLD